MRSANWPPFDLIFFDCDSTLSAIEGIDELARAKGKAGRVGLLTNKAMDGELDLADVYGKRLKAIKPTRAQLKAVEERYWETAVEDAIEVIAALRFLDKQVFIISGGLIDAVMGFRAASRRRPGADSRGRAGIQRTLRALVGLSRAGKRSRRRLISITAPARLRYPRGSRGLSLKWRATSPADA